MNLAGLGIRSIKWCPNGLTNSSGQAVQRYLILAGNANGGPLQRESVKQKFSLYSWTGATNNAPTKLIDDLTGYTVRPEGIDNLGQVVGGYWNPSATEARIFVYSPATGTMDIGPGPGWFLYARDINLAGQISAYGAGIATFAAYRYSPGTGYLLLASSDDVEAGGINDRGQVTGTALFQQQYHAFRYTDGIGLEDLGSLFGGASDGRAINNLGWVTGNSDGWNVFLYRDDLGMTLIGPGIGWAINDQGAIAGETALTPTSGQAFIYLNGSMQLLGNFGGPSEARGINNSNHVVGTTVIERRIYGFLWTEQEGMLLLNSLIPPDSGWHITDLFDINDAGQMVGSGAFNGKPTAVLLDPLKPLAITNPPQSQSVFAGEDVSFSVGVSGSAPTFRWYFNDTPIPGATNRTLNLHVSSTAQAGNYTVVATNWISAVTSSVAKLQVLTSPPVFRRQPHTQAVRAGHP